MFAIAEEDSRDEPKERLSLGRRIAFVIFWVLSIAVYVFFFAVLVGSDAGLDESEAFHTAAAVLYSGVVVAGLLVAWNARFGGAGLWIVIVAGIALLLVLVIVGNPNNRGGQAGWFDVANLVFVVPLVGMAALHPRRSDLAKIGRNINPRLTALAVLAGIPAMAYSIDQALIQRNSWPPKSDPHHNSHWLTSASIVGALALIALVAAVRRRGLDLAAWSFVVGIMILGVVSLLFPATTSGFGEAWGAGAVAVGILFSLEFVRDSRKGTG